MYQLYIGNKNYSSWSLRPWVLLRQLGIPFAEHLLQFGRGGFADISPTGKVPCLHDGDVVVWDSLAIAEYLAERHPGVWPTDRRARAFARCAAAEMHAGFGELRARCSMSCGIRVRLSETPPGLVQDLARLGRLWSEGLSRFGGPFLSGAEFGAVDAFFAPVAFRVQTYGLELPAAPADYARRLLLLPAMQEWYAAALGETFRDEGHEAELRGIGTWLSDLRAQPAG